MDISSYVTAKKREMSLMKKFESLSSKLPGGKKTDLRLLEMRLLRPKPIKKYRGPTSGWKEFNTRSIRLTFPDKKWILRWMKIFRVNAHVEYNTWDLDFIMELIVKLESGRLKWNKEKRCFYLINSKGKRIKI